MRYRGSYSIQEVVTRYVCYMGCSKIIKVFDPGDGFVTAAPVDWRFDSVSMHIFDPGGSSLHQMGCATKHSLEQRKEKNEYAISTVLHECEFLGISSQLVQTRRQTSDHQSFDTMPKLIVERTEYNQGNKSCEYSALRLQNDLGYKASVMASLELDVYLCVDAMIMIVFGPGGTPLYHKGCSSFMPNSEVHKCDFRLNKLTSARAAWPKLAPMNCGIVLFLLGNGSNNYWSAMSLVTAECWLKSIGVSWSKINTNGNGLSMEKDAGKYLLCVYLISGCYFGIPLHP